MYFLLENVSLTDFNLEFLHLSVPVESCFLALSFALQKYVMLSLSLYFYLFHYFKSCVVLMLRNSVLLCSSMEGKFSVGWIQKSHT